MLIKILSDNAQNSPFLSEWGLSLYIEHNGKKILLDTGSSDVFAKNAEKMSVDISDVDFGVLSHAHYDHANGIPCFFSINKKAHFYVRSGSKEDCYSKKNGIYGYIGIKKGVLDKHKDRITYVDSVYPLCDGVWLVPHNGKDLTEAAKKAGMFRYINNRWEYDLFRHEQSLVISTEKGLVIFNSCSHGGADNIINEVSEAFPDKHVYAMIGGFHLYKSSYEEVAELCERIEATDIEKVITGHCTENAYFIMKDKLGEKVQQICPGLEMLI